jgi:cyclic pyranopterin phosphate synthase
VERQGGAGNGFAFRIAGATLTPRRIEKEKQRMADRQPLVDSFGRRINNLRISLTDRCNFRCVYCMPPEGLPMLNKSRFLTTEEIVRFVRIVGRVGVSRYRLTGGEPLLRADIADIVRALKSVPTVEELSVTTNGSRLSDLAAPLREAGLDRVNVSLDSVDKRRFEAVTLSAQYDKVRGGISAALEAGFPVKLNMVVLKGIPDGEILKFVRLAVDHDIEVRFLEFMPLCGEGWEAELVYPISEVRDLVRAHFRLEPQYRGDKTAETYRMSARPGKVGFIASLSEPFCDSCSRMRLTADGKIRPCLFSDYEVSVGDLLRSGADDEELLAAIRTAVANKPRGNQFVEAPFGTGREDGGQVSSGPFIRTVGG